MGIGSESAGALKGSVLYQSPAVLVKRIASGWEFLAANN